MIINTQWEWLPAIVLDQKKTVEQVDIINLLIKYSEPGE